MRVGASATPFRGCKYHVGVTTAVLSMKSVHNLHDGSGLQRHPAYDRLPEGATKESTTACLRAEGCKGNIPTASSCGWKHSVHNHLWEG